MHRFHLNPAIVPLALAYTPGAANPRATALAAVLGALMGDALGVPHEFKEADELPPLGEMDLIMPASYSKTYSAIQYGTWSDDGSQLLCLLDCLVEGDGHLDLAIFGQALLDWLRGGRHQAGGLVYDCGGQTAAALRRLGGGAPADQAALDPATLTANPRSNGNGALMRVIPAALVPVLWGRTAEEAVALAMHQAVVTHAHALSQVTCGLYTQVALMVMDDPKAARRSWRGLTGRAADAVRQMPALTLAHRDALAELMAYGHRELPAGTGYVANSFWSAIHALDRADSYLEAVREAIALGEDTDTTACIAGGLAGLAWGLGSVPLSWWPHLRATQESNALLEGLGSC